MTKILKTIKPFDGEIPNCEEWVKQGRPELWLLCCEANGYKLYSDVGYGKLAITTRNDTVVDIGSDFVCTPDLTHVGLGEYYGLEKPALYKKI